MTSALSVRELLHHAQGGEFNLAEGGGYNDFTWLKLLAPCPLLSKSETSTINQSKSLPLKSKWVGEPDYHFPDFR